jgi:dUTP pyrophosphatase
MNAQVPTRMSAGAAGYDLYASEDAVVPRAVESSDGGVDIGRCLVPTGLAVELPPDTVGRIASRSGLSVRFNLEVGAGWIDGDYRGQVMIELKNFSSTPYEIKRGERIAQLIILPIVQLDVAVVNNLENTSRGAFGFGSTGI